MGRALLPRHCSEGVHAGATFGFHAGTSLVDAFRRGGRRQGSRAISQVNGGGFEHSGQRRSSHGSRAVPSVGHSFSTRSPGHSADLQECFFSLSSRVLRSRRLANTASILFCLSPSPATLSSPYNEPFFAAASYAGMLLVEKDQGFLAACAFAAATSFRANGILNAGFFVWHFLLRPWPRVSPSLPYEASWADLHCTDTTVQHRQSSPWLLDCLQSFHTRPVLGVRTLLSKALYRPAMVCKSDTHGLHFCARPLLVRLTAAQFSQCPLTSTCRSAGTSACSATGPGTNYLFSSCPRLSSPWLSGPAGLSTKRMALTVCGRLHRFFS